MGTKKGLAAAVVGVDIAWLTPGATAMLYLPLVSQRDTRILDFLEASRGYTINFLALRHKEVDGIQGMLEKAKDNPDVAEFARRSFEGRIEDIKKIKLELSDAIAEVRELDIISFKCVLDYFLIFDNKFMNVKTRWKDARIKDYKDEASDLEARLSDSIPKDIAINRLEASLEEVDTGITNRYETLLLNNNSIHAQLLDLVEERNLIINELRNENEELHSIVDNPFPMYGVNDYATAANKVANYYNKILKKKLDCLDWQETELGTGEKC